MRRLRRFETDAGRPLDGILVEVAPEDEAVLGTGSFLLGGNPLLDALVDDLDGLIGELSESGE
jgi:hypothetical protein